jgi:hypothetical protein
MIQLKTAREVEDCAIWSRHVKNVTVRVVPTRIGYRVVVELPGGLTTTWPVRYDDGSIAYDEPWLVPKYARSAIAKAFDVRDDAERIWPEREQA